VGKTLNFDSTNISQIIIQVVRHLFASLTYKKACEILVPQFVRDRLVELVARVSAKGFYLLLYSIILRTFLLSPTQYQLICLG